MLIHNRTQTRHFVCLIWENSDPVINLYSEELWFHAMTRPPVHRRMMNGQRSAAASPRKAATIWTDCRRQILLPQFHHKRKRQSSRKPIIFFVSFCAGKGYLLKWQASAHFGWQGKKINIYIYQAGPVSTFFIFPLAWWGVLRVAATAAWVASESSSKRWRAVPSAPRQSLIHHGTAITRVQMLVPWSRQLWNNFIDSAVTRGDTNTRARTKGGGGLWQSEEWGGGRGYSWRSYWYIPSPPHTHTLFRGEKNGCKPHAHARANTRVPSATARTFSPLLCSRSYLWVTGS